MLYGPNGEEIASRARSKRKSPRVATMADVLDTAERSDFNGWFYLPTALTPTVQSSPLTRRLAAEKAVWLYGKVGAVAMVIDGLALDEVGTGLWPKWVTSDEAFNIEMTDAYHFANHDPRVFSADAEQDAYSAQFAIRRMIRLYGDGFGQLLRPALGAIMPKLSLLPGYLVGNTGSEPLESGWIDGTRADSLGRITEFMLLQKERATEGTPVLADDLLHFHDPFLPGQRRGISALNSVCERLFRREDIRDMLTEGTLAREMVGYAVETAAGSFGGPRYVPPGAESVSEQKNSDGTKYTVVKFATRNGQTNKVTVPQLGAGQTIKTLETNRPATAVMEFLDSILREVAWATLYPPDYVFFLAGMGQGTAVRLVLSKVRNVLASRREFQLKPQFLNRWHVFWAWQYIKSGRVKATVPSDWWKHKIIPVPDISVDIAREGRLYDSRVSENKMSIEGFHGMAGEDADDIENDNLRVIQRRLKKLADLNAAQKTSFTYFDIWPRTQNAMLSVPTVGGTDDNSL
jgi:hypothetical protein